MNNEHRTKIYYDWRSGVDEYQGGNWKVYFKINEIVYQYDSLTCIDDMEI